MYRATLEALTLVVGTAHVAFFIVGVENGELRWSNLVVGTLLFMILKGSTRAP
jgi:hypothetical protein